MSPERQYIFVGQGCSFVYIFMEAHFQCNIYSGSVTGNIPYMLGKPSPVDRRSS